MEIFFKPLWFKQKELKIIIQVCSYYNEILNILIWNTIIWVEYAKKECNGWFFR